MSGSPCAIASGQALKPQSYPMARLCRGEAFDDLVVEVSAKAHPERQWVHCVRGLPVVDREGRPDCLVLIATDATEAFEAEERFERMFNANPAPAVIVRIADLRYVRANAGFLEMSGWRSDDIVGRRLYDIDILQGAERKDLAKALPLRMAHRAADGSRTALARQRRQARRAGRPADRDQ